MAVEVDRPLETNGTVRPYILAPDERHRAFQAARRHSILVKVLRIAFPSIAGLLILSYLFQSNLHMSFGDLDAVVESIEISDKHLKMLNPHLEGFNEKNGNYVVDAKSALQDIKNPQIIKLHAIDSKITNLDNSWSKVVATKGVFNSKSEFLKLTDGVVVTTSSGMTAHLKNADVNMPKKTITTKNPVTVEMPNGVVRASNMTAFTSKRDINFGGGVDVKINGQSQNGDPAATASWRTANEEQKGALTSSMAFSRDKPIHIKSDRLRVSDSKKLAHFVGNVITTQNTQKLFSNTLTVHYAGQSIAGSANGGNTQISRIEAADNVRLNMSQGRKASSDQLDFDPNAETVTMTGNVVLVQGQNVLKGEKLLVELKSAKSQMGPGGRVHGHFVRVSDNNQGKSQRQKNPAKSVITIGTKQMNLQAPEGAPINVEADMLTLDDKLGNAVFNGNVKTVHGKYKLNSQTLTVRYEPSSSKQEQGAQSNLKIIEARGKVLIITPDNQSATSDWAIFDMKSNILTIGGNTVLTQDGNVLKGERLVINLNNGRSQFITSQKQNAGRRVRALFMPKKEKAAGNPGQ